MFADEELVMELLINAGQARSDAMEAIRCAGQKDWQGATKIDTSEWGWQIDPAGLRYSLN